MARKVFHILAQVERLAVDDNLDRIQAGSLYLLHSIITAITVILIDIKYITVFDK
jgi:hypothetical protein